MLDGPRRGNPQARSVNSRASFPLALRTLGERSVRIAFRTKPHRESGRKIPPNVPTVRWTKPTPTQRRIGRRARESGPYVCGDPETHVPVTGMVHAVVGGAETGPSMSPPSRRGGPSAPGPTPPDAATRRTSHDSTQWPARNRCNTEIASFRALDSVMPCRAGSAGTYSCALRNRHLDAPASRRPVGGRR